MMDMNNKTELEATVYYAEDEDMIILYFKKTEDIISIGFKVAEAQELHAMMAEAITDGIFKQTNPSAQPPPEVKH